MTIVALMGVTVYGSIQNRGQMFHRIKSSHNHGFAMQERTQHHLSVSTGKVMLRYKLPVTDLDVSAVDINCGRDRVPFAVPWFCDSHRQQSPLVAMHKTRVETLKYVQRQMNLVDKIFSLLITLSYL